MSDNVTPFPGVTVLDLDPDQLLLEATGKLSSVVILGETEDGSLYFASSSADAGDMLWALERAKYQLMRTLADMEQGNI